MKDHTLLKYGVYVSIAIFFLLGYLDVNKWFIVVYLFLNPATLVFIYIVYKKKENWDFMLDNLIPPDKHGRKVEEGKTIDALHEQTKTDKS